MKPIAVKTLFWLLAVVLVPIVLGGCAGIQLKSEVTSVPDGHLRISIINDTDVVLCHSTNWLNHNVPGIRGLAPVCGGEIQPNKDQTFDRDISSWDFTGLRVYITDWRSCRPGNVKYRSKVISEIPEGTAIIKIYHKHSEAIPR